jgi:hypothetical protein
LLQFILPDVLFLLLLLSRLASFSTTNGHSDAGDAGSSAALAALREENESFKTQLTALQEEGFVREIELQKLAGESEANARDAENARREIDTLRASLSQFEREASQAQQASQPDEKDDQLEALRRELRESQAKVERLEGERQQQQRTNSQPIERSPLRRSEESVPLFKDSPVSPRPAKNKAENLKRSAVAEKPGTHKVECFLSYCLLCFVFVIICLFFSRVFSCFGFFSLSLLFGSPHFSAFHVSQDVGCYAEGGGSRGGAAEGEGACGTGCGAGACQVTCCSVESARCWGQVQAGHRSRRPDQGASGRRVSVMLCYVTFCLVLLFSLPLFVC